MAIDRSNRKWWTGSEPDDLREYLIAYSQETYAASEFHAVRCACGSAHFKLERALDLTRRACLSCGELRFVCGDLESWDEARAEEKIQRYACKQCKGKAADVMLGFALYGGDLNGVKWHFVGVRCPQCGILGCFNDGKIGEGPVAEVIARSVAGIPYTSGETKDMAESNEPIGAKSHHEEQGLEQLYRDVIFEHYRRPQNRGTLESAQIVTKGNNPVCGDRVTLYARVEGGKLTDLKFEGKACAICMASTSMMTQACMGKSLDEAGKRCDHFKAMMRNEAPFEAPADVPDLEALEGVRKFSVRVKCATLGWTTLKNGIVEYQAGRGEANLDDSCST